MNTEVNPAHILRDYIWGVLEANMKSVWDRSKYDGLMPIVPLSEEPELSEFSGPHIVYGYSNERSGPVNARKNGSMSLAIYDQNFRRLGKTINTLHTALDRHDESAHDVNVFSSKKEQYLGLSFSEIHIAFTDGGTPETSEGGEQSGIITISYEYRVDYNVITSI